MSVFDRNMRGGGGRTGSAAPRSLLHGVDLALTLVILGFCALAYYFTTQFEETSALLAGNVPPEWFPRLLIWVIAILSLALPFEHLFLEGGKKKLDEGRSSRVNPMVFFTAVLLVMAVAAIYLVGNALAMVLICALLPFLWGERRPKVLVPFAVLFPAAIAVLFSQVLKIYFEPGLIGPALG